METRRLSVEFKLLSNMVFFVYKSLVIEIPPPKKTVLKKSLKITFLAF